MTLYYRRIIMAQVVCPNCGRERVVVAGKKKNCRKCGTTLTADTGNVKPKRVAASDQERRRQLAEEIDALKAQVGELRVENDELRGELAGLREHLEDVAKEDSGKEDENEVVGQDLERLTVGQLRQYAGQRGIELPGGNKSKGELIAVIGAAGKSDGDEEED
jgi:septal ring factor EnvC (AmiA/AmiB activator)